MCHRGNECCCILPIAMHYFTPCPNPFASKIQCYNYKVISNKFLHYRIYLYDNYHQMQFITLCN